MNWSWVVGNALILVSGMFYIRWRMEKTYKTQIKFLDEFWRKSYFELYDKFRTEQVKRMALEDGEGWKRESKNSD